MSTFEETPRARNIPPICTHANLPSHESAAAYYAWHERWGPGCKVHKVWECEVCKHWHSDTTPPDPAGASSGTGRSSKGESAPYDPPVPTVRARPSQFSSPEAHQAFVGRIG